LELHVGWSAIAPEFQEHPGNNVFIAAIYSQKQELTQSQMQQVMRVGVDSHVFNSQTLLQFLPGGEQQRYTL
jgi:hypothetical protein